VREELTFVDYKALTRALVARRMRRGLVVLFTDLLDEAQSRPLVEAARRARSQSTRCWSSRPAIGGDRRRRRPRRERRRRVPGDGGARGARRAAGGDRGRAPARVEVIDTHAAAMAVAAVNRYLTMKRRRAI